MTPDQNDHETQPEETSGEAGQVPLQHTESHPADSSGHTADAARSTGRQHGASSGHSRPGGNQPGEAAGEIDHERYVFTPPIDIFETEEGLVLHADLPGVSVETLDLQVQDNKLTLFGRVRSTLPAGARPLHREYEEGDFLRSFILSDEVNHEKITATMSNGVLKVVLPRAARAEPRKIQVSTDP
ncbi:MAG: Hsp20/alpha crystallin family protein [Planctomycetaceae bacterium]|nr:Hsp20/alpha crystallin family protein [Planctomycetaceae bacterium]